MRVLITTVHPLVPGGVAGFYRSVRDKFSCDVQYFIIGRRVGERSKIYRFLGDMARFIYVNLNQHIDIVLINPSLDFNAVVRDGLNLILAKLCRKKVIIFFHGWQKSFERRLQGLPGKLFYIVYSRANTILVSVLLPASGSSPTRALPLSTASNGSSRSWS